MALVIKRIKGKLYVYEEYRVNGKAVTKYVGPLEEMVRTYQALKAGLTVNHTMKRKDLRMLAKYIASSVVNLMKSEPSSKWARGDLNPRPPGYQPGAPPG